MGKRRIRNLIKIDQKQLLGFDIRQDRATEVRKRFKIQTFTNIKEAISENPNIMIIATPPDQHKQFAQIAIKNNINVFLEVNLIYKDVESILKKMNKKSIVVCSSNTMIFHPIVKKLKKLIEQNSIGKIYSINHNVGHYLPDWHPWEDYRKFFVSRKKTGGARELMPVEMIWLTYLFSDVKSVFANVKKISKLDVQIDDLYQVILEFKNNIFCTLSIDVFAIPSFKETKIIGEKGTILCDFNQGLIKINKGRGWKSIKVKTGKVAPGYKGTTPSESLYEEEIQRFLKAVKKIEPCSFSLKNELKILKLLETIELSSRIGKKIKL